MGSAPFARTPGRRSHPSLWHVKEADPWEASAQIDADGGRRVGRAVRADDHLVLAPEAIEKGEEPLGIGDEDRFLIVYRDADREGGQLPVPFPTSASRSPA